MNNKKVLIIGGVVAVVLIIGAILFAMAGGKKTETPETGDKISLVYWGLWEPESVMKPLIDRYEEQNPNVTIQYVQKPYTQYEANVFTRIQQNVTDNTPAPDIIRINNTWLSKFQSYLSAVPTTTITPSEYAQTFYPTAVKDFTGTDGNIYAIPLEIDGLALFYNKKLFNDAGLSTPPEDWDTFIEYAKKLTKSGIGGEITQAGAALGTAKNIKHSADILNLLFLQNGVNIISTDNKVVNLAETRAQSALQFYTNFVTEHKTWSSDLASDLEAFYSGTLAMMLAPSWRAFDVINSSPNIEFGIASMPQLPGNDPVNYAMYWGDAVPATSPYKAQAWHFIDFLSQPQQMKELFSNSSQIRAFGEPYSRKDLASDLADNPYAAAFIDMASTMKAWKMGEQGYIEESLKTAINDVIEGDIDANQALSEAQERINIKLAEVIK